MALVGTCRLQDDGTAHEIVLDGFLPIRRTFVGTGLSCRVSLVNSAGPATLTLTDGNSRTRSRIVGTGSTAVVTLS